MVLLGQLWDLRAGSLADREANWCYQSLTPFAWEHRENMYKIKGFGVLFVFFFFFRKKVE